MEGEESDTGYVRETKIYHDFNVKQGWKLPEEMRASKSSGGGMLGTHTQSKALRYTSFLLSGCFSDAFFKKVDIRKGFVLSNFNNFLASQMMF